MLDISISYSDLEYFLLVLVRVSCFIYIVPFFSMSHVPNRYRIALAVAVSVLLYGATSPHVEVEYTTVMGYAMIVIREALAGILIGMGSNLCMSILALVGAVADMEIGFSMVTMIDPATKSQTTITSTMYQYFVTLILLLSGMYEYVLGALADSYRLIPVNGAVFHSEKLLNAMAIFMSEYISVGFRICLPIFAATLLLNVVLGIMAKVSPQMNMFAVGLQLKILVGLVIIFVTIGLLPIASDMIFTEAKKMTVSFVEAIM